MKLKLYLLIVALGFFSCGQSAKDIAHEQQKRDDSVRNATRIQLQKIAVLKDSLLTMQSLAEGINNRLIIDKANLDAAKDKLNAIKQYQLMRTVAEREAQVRNQSINIQQLELELKNREEQLKRHYQSIAELQAQLK